MPGVEFSAAWSRRVGEQKPIIPKMESDAFAAPMPYISESRLMLAWLPLGPTQLLQPCYLRQPPLSPNQRRRPENRSGLPANPEITLLGPAAVVLLIPACSKCSHALTVV